MRIKMRRHLVRNTRLIAVMRRHYGWSKVSPRPASQLVLGGLLAGSSVSGRTQEGGDHRVTPHFSVRDNLSHNTMEQHHTTSQSSVSSFSDLSSTVQTRPVWFSEENFASVASKMAILTIVFLSLSLQLVSSWWHTTYTVTYFKITSDYHHIINVISN